MITLTEIDYTSNEDLVLDLAERNDGVIHAPVMQDGSWVYHIAFRTEQQEDCFWEAFSADRVWEDME